MDLDLVINIIEEKSYLGLFVWLWFGLFVFPVPNEVTLMTIGLASSMGALNPFAAFIVAYIGILAAFTTTYTLGRLIGTRIIEFLEKRKRFAAKIESSMKMMERYHAFSLLLSCFIPGARYLIPLLYGSGRLPFRTFAFFAYSGAFVWVLIMFVLGYLFEDKMKFIMKYSEEMSVFVLLAAVVAVGILINRRKKIKNINAKKKAIGTEGAILNERRQE